MKAKEFLENVCKEIKYKPANKPISEELEAHIQDIKDEYLCEGYSEQEAEEKAVEQMGNPKQIGKRLNKIHRPKLDLVIIGLIVILLGFRVILTFKSWIEWINLYGYSFSILDFFSTEYHLIKYSIIGLIFGMMIYFFDYRKTKKMGKFNVFCSDYYTDLSMG